MKISSKLSVILLFVPALAANAGKGHSSYSHMSKAPPTKTTQQMICKEIPYTVEKQSMITKSKREPYDCSVTRSKQECHQVAVAVPKWCSKTEYTTETHDCPQDVQELVCEEVHSKQPQYHSKKGSSMGRYLKKKVKHSKKQPSTRCRLETRTKMQKCLKQVPQTVKFRCDQQTYKDECREIPYLESRTCEREVSYEVPVTRQETKYKKQCTVRNIVQKAMPQPKKQSYRPSKKGYY